MKTYKNTVVTDEPCLVIRHDDNTKSPRIWGNNLGYFITVDRGYHSPDKNPKIEAIVKDCGEYAKSQEEHMVFIKNNWWAVDKKDKLIAICPIVKYEHGGVSYSLGTKHGFDYSNNGFYIVTEKTAKKHGAKLKDFEKVIRQEIEIYNKYINGEVYGFTLQDTDGKLVDSCWGFYDLEDIRSHLPKEYAKEDLTKYIKY